ncbi:cysteine hydrolase family protein [Streptomyces sp. NPDC050418]|uniref:cysteine hydrolase family protein n=1 Tax=Streptomyces sp. NPDC050418 TaxID=3365612 RepID=UPI0037926347
MSGVRDPYTEPHFESSALITIDVQRDFLSEAPYGIPGTSEVLPQLRELAKAFREAGRPVVHVVRLYEVGGGNAEPVRRRLLESGVELAAPGSEGSWLAEGIAQEGAPEVDGEMVTSGVPQVLGPGEYAVFKPRWGAFYGTSLQELLTELKVDTLVFAGCNLPNCPRASIIQACERDYRVVLASDAVSRVSEQGLEEIAGLGVHPLGTAGIVAAVTGGSAAE